MRLLRADLDYQRRLFVASPGGFWQRWDTPPAEPTSTIQGVAATPHVSEGRWVVDCPCGGAQLAAEAQERFFCVECLNEWAGGQWVPVEWHADSGKVEAALVKRRDVRTMHWQPDAESLADIRRENRDRGVV